MSSPNRFALTLGLLLAARQAHAVELDTSPMARGAVATFVATGASPGATVVFVAGTTPGTTCADRMAACIRPGVELGRAVADDEGRAVFMEHLGEHMPVGQFLFQAVEAGDTSTASALVRAEITAPAGSGRLASHLRG